MDLPTGTEPSPEPSARQRHAQKAQSRRAILASAAAIVRERGGEALSVKDAMAGAGLTVGAFYAHFDSKTELLEEALRFAFEPALDQLAYAGTGEGALQRALYYYLYQPQDVAVGCPLPAALSDAALQRDNFAPQSLAKDLRALSALLAGAGGLSDDEALAMTALMIGARVIARAVSETPLAQEVLAACAATGTRLANAAPPPPASDRGPAV